MAKKNKKSASVGKKSKGSASTAKAKKTKGKKKAAGLAPKPVTTGKGASPVEIGADLVALFNSGKGDEVERKWWSKKIVSVEGVGVNLAWHGRKAVEAKNNEWMATHKIHGAVAEGPYVGSSGFSVKFRMDVEDTTTGKRETMEEVGVYTVEKGKIAREEFMYHVPMGA